MDNCSSFHRSFFLCLSIGCLLLYSSMPYAQTYPEKHVKLVTPMAPGGGLDLLARYFGDQLSKQLGQSFLVENRAGANGNLGAEVVARSPADGYTLLATYVGTQAINASLYSNLKFDPIEDFKTVAGWTKTSYFIAVHPSLQANSLKELVTLLKANPGKFIYGSAGSGSLGHLGPKQFEMLSGVSMVHIPYKGTGPALLDVLAGRAQVIFNTYGSIGQHVQKGTLRALAVAGNHRSPALPDVPSTAEQGYPDLDVSGWYGLVAPRDTPQPIVNRLNSAVNTILKEPGVIQWLHQRDYEPFAASPEQFSAFLKAEKTKWEKVIKASGAKID